MVPLDSKSGLYICRKSLEGLLERLGLRYEWYYTTPSQDQTTRMEAMKLRVEISTRIRILAHTGFASFAPFIVDFHPSIYFILDSIPCFTGVVTLRKTTRNY